MSPTNLPARLALTAVLALGGSLAACGAQGEPPAPPPGADVVVTGTDGLRYEPEQVTIPSGGRLGLVCAGNLPHNIVVTTASDDIEVVTCGGREAAEAVVDLPAGGYDFFCSIPGHREAGMVGTMTVQ